MKLITVRTGTFKINKDIMGEKKNVETECASLVDVADWVIKRGIVEPLIESVLCAVDEAPEPIKVDKVIQGMLDDPSLIVSPIEEVPVA